MRRTSLLLLLLCATAPAFALPGEAAAQHRRAVPATRPIVARGHYYRPYYRPYYYAPFYWGVGMYGWYPYSWYGYGWYPYGPYPPFGYYPPYYYSNASSIRIQVTPREAQVYLDGYYVGVVDDFDGFSQRLTIPPGEHHLQVYLQGYRTIREKRLFLPNTSYKIKQPMEQLAPGEAGEPRPAPSERPAAPGPAERREPPNGREPQAARSAFGRLAVRTQPGDATIRVDGQEWQRPAGEAPFVLELPEGTHHLEVLKSGLETFSREVEIRAGETTTLNVSLPEK